MYWEYTTLLIDSGNRDAQLANMGRDRWELVSVERGRAYFKRTTKKRPKLRLLLRFWGND